MTISDLQNIKGGYDDKINKDACWCTCHCMELDISGFQLGMMANVSTGMLENPKCSAALTTLFKV